MFETINNKKIYVLSNTICVDAVGIHYFKSGKVYNNDTRKFNQEFVSLCERQIELSREYIRLCGNSQTYQYNSYSLKHRVEEFFSSPSAHEYIGNGNFIVALALENIKFYLLENVSFFTYKKISLKSVKTINCFLSYNVLTRLKPLKSIKK